MLDSRTPNKPNAVKMPLVSVVIPVFNGAKYLGQSIESCLAQTYQNWELLVVDDCSTDETPAVIKHYAQKDNRIRTVRNQENCRLPASLNRGFGMAHGDYFAWIASDDCFRPEALERTISYLEANPTVDLVYSDFSTIDQDGKTIETVAVPEPEILAIRNKVGPCRFYRRSVHEKLGGFDEALFLVEDYDFLLRAFCQFQLQPLHQDLYLFRLHESALTSTHATQVPYRLDLAKEKNLPLLRQKSSRLAAQCHISLVATAVLRQETERARRHALAALWCAPVYALWHRPRRLIAAMLGEEALRTLWPARSRN